MKVDVIVVTYNSSAVIAQCIGAVSRVLPDSRICVVDNASEDCTSDAATSASDHVAVVHSGGNLGYARACNLAFEYLSPLDDDVVLVLNPDLVLSGGSEASIRKAFIDAQVTHAVGVEQASGRSYLNRATPDWFEILRYSVFLLLPRWFPVSWLGRLVSPQRKSYASGAMVAVRAEAWRRACGFDEDFFLYYEDRDFSERLGGRRSIAVIPSLVGKHSQGMSSAASTSQSSLLDAMSGWLLYVSKHRGPSRARRRAGALARVQLLLVGILRLPCEIGFARARHKATELWAAADFLLRGIDGRDGAYHGPSVRVLSTALGSGWTTK